jgi:phosphate:Na+ symporter
MQPVWVLQGSSVVNLMLLAFTGAGILPLTNALAVIVGTNIGTTLDSWLVVSIGFKFSIEQFAFPISGIAGLAMFLSGKEGKLHLVSRLVLGFGLLFVGLHMMKSSMEEVLRFIDLTHLPSSHPLFYFLLGAGITFIIQSSFATVALVLSALYVGGLPFFAAAALVLGAEVGTTIKLLLAAIGSVPVKKRLALANFLMNSITALIVLAFLGPAIHWIQTGLGIHNELYALVFFQTVVNVVTFLIFYPLLFPFARLLGRSFRKEEDETLFIHKVSHKDTGLALEAFKNEARYFIAHVAAYGEGIVAQPIPAQVVPMLHKEFSGHSLVAQYDYLKQLHGNAYHYYLQLQQVAQDPEEIQQLQRLMAALRNGMYAAKSLKDASLDTHVLANSSNEVKYAYYIRARSNASEFFNRVFDLLLFPAASSPFQPLRTLYQDTVQGYEAELDQLYRRTPMGTLSETEISTLVNCNRELHAAYKSLVMGMKEVLLEKGEADYFDEMPGFLR